MKNFIILALLFLPLVSLAASNHQDIVFKTKLDRSTSSIFIDKIRQILVERELGDPYQQSLGDVTVEFSQVMERLPPETQQWVRDLQDVLPLRIFDSEYRLIVRNFGYTMQSFEAELKPLSSTNSRNEYVTLNHAEGLSLQAASISFEVKLPEAEGEEPIVFEVTMLHPSFIIDPEVTAAIPMGWSTALMPGELFLSLHTINISKMFQKLKERPDLIAFSMKDLILPDVAIRIGNREIVFDHGKIKRFLKQKEAELKLGILEMLEARMQRQLENVLADSPMELHFSRSFELRGKMNGKFVLDQVRADERSIFRADISGSFINQSGSEISVATRREVPDAQYDQSMEQIDLSLEKKSAHLALSVSEHYLNQIIHAAIDSGSVNLDNEGFRFGPEKLFVLAEKKGQSLSLYLDIIHKLSNSQRVLVGRSELRFPVKLDIGVKVVNSGVYPRLQIKVTKIDTSDEDILNGISKYKLLSNVGSVRFSKKVLASIREEIDTFQDKMLVDLEIKELQGTQLEKLSFSSDGLGRATALLSLER